MRDVLLTMGLPSVAVLLATYNGEVFLEPQLQSLAAQQDVHVSLLVRDDGSRDGTLDILRTYASRWPALATLQSGDNLGAARSFLTLLGSASSEHDYFAFCDQDDVWLPGKLARAVAQLAELGDTPALYCSRVSCVDEQLRPLGLTPSRTTPTFSGLLFENVAYGCSVVMNRAARALLVQHDPGSAIVMHDWWAALVVSAFGRVIFDDVPGVLYRQHGRNTVGAQTTRLGEIARNVRVFRKQPSSLYPIHAQAAALLALYGPKLSPTQRERTRRLVDSKRSLAARLTYVLSPEITRSRTLDTLAARGLVLAGWY